MKQVPKEDYEVLKKYHRSEVRYFVEFGHETKTRKGGRKVENRRLQMTTKKYRWSYSGTLEEKSYNAIRVILNNDPTQIIGRNDLAAQITRKTNLSKIQATQTIGELLKKGLLRFAG